MGIVLWILSGSAAFLIARIIPLGRQDGRPAELASGIVTGLAFGVVATALDFGGWGELDWRAALFAFFGGFGAIGLTRAVRRRSPPPPAAAAPPDRHRARS